MSMTLVQVVVSGLLLGAIYALFSSGLTLIWGMMNVVNFAHGDFVMLGMYTAVVVWTALGGGPWASVPIAAIVIATLGIASYFLLVRHIMRGPMLAQILGTFGLALFLRYSAFNVFGASFRTLPDTLVGGSFVLGGIRFEGARVLAGGVGLLVTLALHFMLTRTALGGFGSVLGALIAGLLIGVVESVAAFEIGPVYKDVIVYALFVLVLWVRPQGLMGKQ